MNPNFYPVRTCLSSSLELRFRVSQAKPSAAESPSASAEGSTQAGRGKKVSILADWGERQSLYLDTVL